MQKKNLEIKNKNGNRVCKSLNSSTIDKFREICSNYITVLSSDIIDLEFYREVTTAELQEIDFEDRLGHFEEYLKKKIISINNWLYNEKINIDNSDINYLLNYFENNKNIASIIPKFLELKSVIDSNNNYNIREIVKKIIIIPKINNIKFGWNIYGFPTNKFLIYDPKTISYYIADKLPCSWCGNNISPNDECNSLIGIYCGCQDALQNNYY